MTFQRAYFPVDVVNVLQGYGTKSDVHKFSYSLDLAGCWDEFFAPFDCKVTKIYQPKNLYESATTVWLTSTKKVLAPNGYYGYLTISITYPSIISKIKLGRKFQQGDYLFKDGVMDVKMDGYIHLEVAKGRRVGWTKNTALDYVEYVIKNAVKPEEYLFLKESSIIKNDVYKKVKYKFVKESAMIYIVDSDETLLVYKTPGYNYSSVVGEGLKKGEEVIKFFTLDSMSYICSGVLGYVASRYLKKKK